jgi:DNA polymerase-4
MVEDINLPQRLYLDFDSFFASAEQHFNPSLREKPVGVVALDSPHTGCIAVRRLLTLRTRTRTSIFDLERLSKA